MRINIFFYLFLFISPHINAQSHLSKHSRNVSKKINFTPRPNEQQKITNLFISEIEKFEKNTQKGYELTYTESVHLLKNKDNYYLQYQLSGFKLNGENATYRGLCLLHALMPSEAEIRVVFRDQSGKVLYNFRTDTCCITPSSKTTQWEFLLTPTDTSIIAQTKTMEMAGRLAYNLTDIEDFRDFIKSVEDYYRLSPQVNELRIALNTIKTNNIDMMPLYQIDINNIMRRLQQLESEAFLKKLNLQENDPLHFNANLSELRRQAEITATAVNHLMSSIEEVYFNRGYTYFLRNDYNNAIAYFERAIKANPNYVRAYYRLAEVYFIQGHIEKSGEVILQVLNKTVNLSTVEDNVLALTTQIQLGFIEKAELKTANELYHDALAILEKAEAFCVASPFIECNPNINISIAKARHGLYRSYLIIAAKALENDRLELAAKFIHDASRFQKEHSNDIISNMEADQSMQRIINRLIEKGRQYSMNQRFDKAVSLLEKAYELCSENPTMLCSSALENEMKEAQTGLYRNVLVLVDKHIKDDNLAEAERLLEEAARFEAQNPVTTLAQMETENLRIKVNKMRYRQLKNEGTTLLQIGKSDEALEKFLQAKKIEQDYVAFPDPFLNEYIRNAALPLINETLSQAKIKIWGNDLKSAQLLYQSLEKGVADYFLSNDSAITAQMKDLDMRIGILECHTLNFELGANFREAQRLASNKAYKAAYESLNHTLSKVKNKNDCDINTTDAAKFSQNIQPMYFYQKNTDLAFNALESASWHTLDSLLTIAAMLYEKDKGLQKAFNEVNHNDIFSMTSNCRLLKEAALHYFSSNKPETAFKALANAERRNCDAADFLALQKETARLLATQDFKNKERNKAGDFLNIRTNQNEWFIEFDKMYKKTWRKQRFRTLLKP